MDKHPISIPNDVQISPSNTVTSSSVESFQVDEPKMQDKSALPAGTFPAVPPASVPPHFPARAKHTSLEGYSFFEPV